MIELASPLANKLFLITGGDYDSPPREIELIRVKGKVRTSFMSRVVERILVDLRVLRVLLKIRREIDVVIFFLGTTFPAPLVFAQALGIKCFIVLANTGSKESGDWRFGDLVRIRLSEAVQRVSFYFADKLIVYSPAIIDQVKLRRYDTKIVVAREHFVDFDLFRFKNDIEQRENVVGYVGRLSEEKGILNFVNAIPHISKARNDVMFLIIGEGSLEKEIKIYLRQHAPHGKVKCMGWIPHHELPDYLTSLKLLVLPSYEEGLPNVMLEAMACGTPFLATPVGAIPDVIKDKETGFLIRDNSPTCLAEAIVETLAYSYPKQITINARNFVENEFRYEKLVDVWTDIICNTKSV